MRQPTWDELRECDNRITEAFREAGYDEIPDDLDAEYQSLEKRLEDLEDEIRHAKREIDEIEDVMRAIKAARSARRIRNACRDCDKEANKGWLDDPGDRGGKAND